jgi:hypothetical protein
VIDHAAIDHAAIDQQRRERLALLSDPRVITDAEALPWVTVGMLLIGVIGMLVCWSQYGGEW